MINVCPFSTQANTNETIRYNLRDETEIRKYVHYVLTGNKQNRPLYIASRGFRASVKDPNTITDEMISIQELYNKMSGLRVRGLIVTVSKDELYEPVAAQQITLIADRFSDCIFLSGFQTAYGVFDTGNAYNIYYAINPVCFVNGIKFHQNHTDILAYQQDCAESVVAEITGKTMLDAFNFDSLEYA